MGKIIIDDKEREKVIHDIKEAQQELWDNQDSVNILQQAHLEGLTEKRSHQWRMTSAEALHIINKSEKSKKLHGKHMRLLRSDNDVML